MELKVFQINCVANSGINTPQMVDYRHIGLFKRIIEEKGLPVREEFYEFLEEDVYSNLIVEEVYGYFFQAPFYTGKTTSVNWYNLDGTIGMSTNFTYMFTTNEKLAIGATKRNNILSNAKFYAVNTIGDNVYALLDYCESQISVYVQGNTPPLVARVNQSVGVITGMTQNVADNINAILTDL